MDLLFKRYASPFLFIDGMIQTGRFSEFVVEFVETINREKENEYNWEFFLHKVWEGTFEEFREEIENSKQNRGMTDRTIETTVQHSMNILNNFNPAESEGGDC